MLDECVHEGEDAVVVGCGRQNQTVIAESILNSLGHIVAGKIRDNNLLAAFLLKKLCQFHNGLFGIAVDRSVGDQNTFVLGCVGRPFVIEVDVIAQIFVKHGAVQRADDPDVETGGLFEQVLGLQTILAYDAEIVAAGFACPAFGILYVIGTELAEAVCGEEDFVGAVISDHDFRPVHHGRKDKVQDVGTQLQLVAVLDDQLFHSGIQVKELSHEGKGLCVAHDSGVGVGGQEIHDIGGVVGLHVLHDQIIRFSAAQDFLYVAQPFIGKSGVHSIHDDDLLVQDHVGIVGHAEGNHILTLEQVDIMIVDADIFDRICDLHNSISISLNHYK